MRKKIVLIVIGCLIGLVLFNYLYPGSPHLVEAADPVEMLAHRGRHTNWEKGTYDLATGCEATHIYPPTTDLIENTIESIGAAFDAGATIVEIDIRPTHDDQLAIYHDYRLECRTDGEGDIGDFTMAELKALDIGYAYTADGGATYPFRGQGIGKMPTLVEVLDAYPDRAFLIDHKDGTPETADLLADILRAYPADQRSRVYYWGPPDVYAEHIAPAVPEVRRLLANRSEVKACYAHYLLTFGWGGFGETCRGLVMGLPAAYTPALVGWPYRFLHAAHRNDIRFFLMVDSAEEAAAYAHLPTDGVITDYIEIVGPIYEAER